METNVVEIINSGFIKPEYVKNVTHCFCAAVEHECRLLKTEDLNMGYDELHRRLSTFSYYNSKDGLSGIRPIKYAGEDLLGYFFNQKNEIPGYVHYWFTRYYKGIFDAPKTYTARHMQTYNELRRLYIEHNRWLKKDRKETQRTSNQLRRIVSKAFRSGKYEVAFRLYNKDLTRYVDEEEINRLTIVLPDLFGNQVFNRADDAEIAAYAFLIGRLQGRYDGVKYASVIEPGSKRYALADTHSKLPEDESNKKIPQGLRQQRLGTTEFEERYNAVTA